MNLLSKTKRHKFYKAKITIRISFSLEMGNSIQCTLSAEEMENHCKSTVFTADEVRALWFHFKLLNGSHEYINRK